MTSLTSDVREMVKRCRKLTVSKRHNPLTGLLSTCFPHLKIYYDVGPRLTTVYWCPELPGLFKIILVYEGRGEVCQCDSKDVSDALIYLRKQTVLDDLARV